MTNKIIVHGAGGAGINISTRVMEDVACLGEGFCDIEFNYIDTSDSNINAIKPQGKFFRIVSKSHGDAAIDGSGGERRSNPEDIMLGVRDYLDGIKVKARVTGEFHVVIFSASGGSGSNIGPLLINTLQSRGIPVIAVIVSDSSHNMGAKGAKNVLATLDAFSKANGKCLSVVYVNNHGHQKSDGSGLSTAVEEVNTVLRNTLSTISLFLSGAHESLDYADMLNIIDQSNYKTVTIPTGLYALVVTSKTVVPPKNAIPMLGRSLTIPNVPHDTNISFQHYKVGIVKDANVLEIFKDQFPVHMLAYGNYFNGELKALDKIIADMDQALKNVHNDDISGDTGAGIDPITGLFL